MMQVKTQKLINWYLNAVQKSKNYCGANYLSVTVISNRKCHEKCVLFAPQWFFDFWTAFSQQQTYQKHTYKIENITER
jgi:hypothetical protein